jgi:hypothetical protein
MNLHSHELRESVKFGSMMEDKFGSHDTWRFPEWGDSRTSKKQSQSCCLKKSDFSVWTSGRFVNIWDVKDTCVCVHTRNIVWVQGYCRNVKVPPSPYKRGCEGTCKRIHNFWGTSYLWEILCLLLLHLRLWLERLHTFFSCVRGSYPDFWIPPNKVESFSKDMLANIKSQMTNE